MMVTVFQKLESSSILSIRWIAVLFWALLIAQEAFSLTLYVKSPYPSQQLFVAGNQEFGWWSGRQMVSQADDWFMVNVTMTTTLSLDVLSVYPDLGRTSSLELGSMESIFQNLAPRADEAYVVIDLNGQVSVSDSQLGNQPISSSVMVSSRAAGSSSSTTNLNTNSSNTPNTTNTPADLTDLQDLGTIVEDTLYIAYGDSIEINAKDANLSEWSGDTDFLQLNDSTLRVSPASESKYYLKSYSRLNITNENSSFELPVRGKGTGIVEQNTIPGWRTTAKDGKIEVWRDAHGVVASDGDQFVELNANFQGNLFQDIQTAGGEEILIEFAHRGRMGPDRLGLKIGPPEGPYTTIGEYTGSTDKWALHQEIIQIPVGQTSTRIFFTSEGFTNSSVGNFLDAISYTRTRASTDSVVVIVQYPMEVSSPIDANIYDDGDGIADSLVIDFDVDLTNKNRFDSVTVYWGKDSSNYLWRDFTVQGDQLILSQQRFSTMVYTGKVDAQDQMSIKFHYSDLIFQTGTQIEKSIEIQDQVGPVLVQAFLIEGDRQMIIAMYSEPVQTDFGQRQNELILYQSKASGNYEAEYFYEDFELNSDLSSGKIYHAENMLASKDSLRLSVLQGVTDLNGNHPHKDNAYVQLSRQQALNVSRSSMAVVPEQIEGARSIALEMVDQNLSAEDIPASIGRIGARIDLDYMSFLKNYENIDPSLIKIEWTMYVYTSLGGFIDKETGVVECYDAKFEGGCLVDDRMLYVGWNMLDINGRKAGSGAYIGRVSLDFKYDDRVITESNELWTFGVRRSE